MLSQETLLAFVPTLDAARARTFYEGTLGLTFVSVDSFALVLDANGTTIRVSVVHELVPAPFTVLGWRVSNVQETAAGLRAKGVSFERFEGLDQDAAGIWSAPSGAKVAWFKDPDGNVLSITQY